MAHTTGMPWTEGFDDTAGVRTDGTGWVPRMSDADTAQVEGRGAYLLAALAAVTWYAVPTGLYLLWALLLDGDVRPDCVDAAGTPCLSPRGDALRSLTQTLPMLSAAFAVSVLAALPLRRATSTWHPLTIGFTAAAAGIGITAVLLATLAPAGA